MTQNSYLKLLQQHQNCHQSNEHYMYTTNSSRLNNFLICLSKFYLLETKFFESKKFKILKFIFYSKIYWINIKMEKLNGGK